MTCKVGPICSAHYSLIDCPRMSLLRRRSDEPISRGQAMVEFALVLPVLALLLVVAIDFGRVFFGWVSLTNAARVGANYAGYTPDLLSNPADRSEYGTLVDDAVTGCDLTPADTDDAAYDPTFTDIDGDGKDNGWGDHATVTISCEFDLITPLTEVLFSEQVAMQAEAVFPIRDGTFVGPGGGGTPPNPPCTQALIPDLMNRTVAEARQKWVDEGFPAANFSPPPGTDEDYIVNSQTFSPSALVQDCVDPAIQSVFITSVPPPPCPAGQAQVPNLLGMLVLDAKLAWTDAGFSGAFKPNNAVDSKTVLTQVTSPSTSPPINGCVTVAAEVTITYGDPPAAPCEVPNMIGLTFPEAEDLWNDAGFNDSGSNPLVAQGNANKKVTEQSPNHPGTVSCDVAGKVKLQ